MLEGLEYADKAARADKSVYIAWKHAGLTNALHGSEDDMMPSTLKEVWRQRKMSEWRTEYLGEAPGWAAPQVLYACLEGSGGPRRPQ